jgi:Domain of unknown function (DUF4337)
MNQYLEPDNMTEELQELHEHAEHAREHPDLAPITISMAVLAVLVATVSLLGHRTHTEEIILQNKVTDQWGYYQAKNIRRHTDELFADLTTVMATKDPEATAKLQQKYRAEADRYKDEQKELDSKARETEAETEHATRKADRFDLGEVFLEVALVITSITLLSGRRIFWHLGLLLATAGVLIAASAFMLH